MSHQHTGRFANLTKRPRCGWFAALCAGRSSTPRFRCSSAAAEYFQENLDPFYVCPYNRHIPQVKTKARSASAHISPNPRLMKSIVPRLAIIALAVSALSLVSSASAQTAVAYSNTTTFTGFAATNGGVTSDTGTRQTVLMADDLSYDPALSLLNVTQIRFSLANLNTSSQALSPSVRFYANDGVNGGPGTLIFAVNFNPITLGAQSVSLLTYNIPLANQFVLPASGTVWAGVFFSSSTQTAAVMNNFGMGIYNPPTVGSSADRAFWATTPGTYTGNNPAGDIEDSPFGGSPVGNFGWQVTVVPEPSTYALLLIGAAAGIGAWKRRRK
jgi:hypothetical protein